MNRRFALLLPVLAASGLSGQRSAAAHDGPHTSTRPGGTPGRTRDQDTRPRNSVSTKSLEDPSHQLDEAAQALLKSLMETPPDKRARGRESVDAELMTIMGAASLQGQARVFHELVEGENPDFNFQLAVRELDRQLSLVDRSLRGRALSRAQRDQLSAADAAMENLLRAFRRSEDRRLLPREDDPRDR